MLKEFPGVNHAGKNFIFHARPVIQSGRDAVADMDEVADEFPLVIADHHIHRESLGIMVVLGQAIPVDPVVAVKIEDVFPAGGIEPGLARADQPAIGFGDHLDARIGLSPGFAYFQCIVGGAIVHQDDFQILVALPDDAADALV